MTASKNARKKGTAPGRPFEPGHPGGPGRPAGSRNKATLILDKMAGDDAEAVLRKQLELAKNGDQRAAEIVLSRVWAVRRGGRPVVFDLPQVETAADIVKAVGNVVTAVAGGELTPEEGNAVAAILEVKRKAIETTDLETRITALEQRK